MLQNVCTKIFRHSNCVNCLIVKLLKYEKTYIYRLVNAHLFGVADAFLPQGKFDQ